MGMSSETVRIVSSGSCRVRELWRVAAACGQTKRLLGAYGTSNRKTHTSLPFPYPLECTGRAMLAANKRSVNET